MNKKLKVVTYAAKAPDVIRQSQSAQHERRLFFDEPDNFPDDGMTFEKFMNFLPKWTKTRSGSWCGKRYRKD